MRLLPALVTLSLVAFPALAEPAAPNDPPTETRQRVTWQQRFVKANQTGDGRLTLEQARTGYPTVARNFQDIDIDGKGYVTQDDIRAWHKVRREARVDTKKPVEDPLRPRAAFQRTYPDSPQANTTTIGGTTRGKEFPPPSPTEPTVEALLDEKP
jgi:hypothetical protein